MIRTVGHKVNLGLDVLRKREDGYHDIETLFIPCRSFTDTLEIVADDRFSIDIMFGKGPGWDPLGDLTVKAYRLLEEEFGLPGVRIRLEKGIPVGAGLGGGSADAAIALTMLRDMFSLPLSDEELARRASSLGSDCAFFIYDRPMFGRGRGEILEPFELDLSPYEIRVEMPEGVSVSTREAYSGIYPHMPSESMRTILASPVSTWKGRLKNDFEASVFSAHPEIAALKEKFYSEGAVYASMSGSGAAAFGLFAK